MLEAVDAVEDLGSVVTPGTTIFLKTAMPSRRRQPNE
jgi:hypothetical protein